MTREFNTFGKNFECRTNGARIAAGASARQTKKGLSFFFKSVSSAYKKAVKAKRDISDSFVNLTEVLADKTAREGLFGEDRGRSYCGTDTDYIA